MFIMNGTQKPLGEMNIHEKRKYAKSIGIHAPTTLSLQMIDEAIRLREKELGIVQKVYSIYDMIFEDRIKLNFLINAKAQIQKGQSGYFMPLDNGDGVLRYLPFQKSNEMDIYVPKNFVSTYNMRIGDLAGGDVYTLIHSKIRILRDIKYINSRTANTKFPRRDFDNLVTSEPTRKMTSLSNNDILSILSCYLNFMEGQYIGVRSNNKRDNFDGANAFYTDAFSSYNGQLFTVCDEKFVDELDKVHKTPMSFILSEDEDNINYMIERLKRLVEEGVNVVILTITQNEALLERLKEYVGNYEFVAVTVFDSFGLLDGDTKVRISNGKIVVDESYNKHENNYFTEVQASKMAKIKKKIHDATPSELLSRVVELREKSKFYL